MSEIELDDLPIVREIGTRLRAVATRVDAEPRRPTSSRQRARLRPAAALIVATLVIAAGVLLIAGPGGARLDPVAEARAALSTEGSVLHMVISGGLVQPDGTPVRALLFDRPNRRGVQVSRRYQRWLASDPVRTRSESRLQARDGTPAGTISEGRAADGTRWSRSPGGSVRTTSAAQIAAIERQAGRLANASPRDRRQEAIEGTEDPVVVLRRLFDSGQFRPGAERVRDGRRVRDLVAAQGGRRFENGAVMPATRTVYTVDADSFAPIEIRRYHEFQGSAGPSLQHRTVVESYERLAPDDLPRDFFDVPDDPRR